MCVVSMILNGVLYSVSAVAVVVGMLLLYALYIRPRLRPTSTCPDFPPLSKAKDILKRGLKLKELPRQADVIVIGSGPSGLSAAVLLAKQGKKVVVFEQHDRVGGGLHTFEEKGFEFDTGFHYCGEMWEGSPLRMIVDALTGGYVKFNPMKTCPIEPGVFDELEFVDYPNKDGKNNVFKVRAGVKNWIQDLKRKFPEESAGIDAYLDDIRVTATSFLLYQIWRSFPAFMRRLLAFIPRRMHGVTGHTGLEAFRRYTRNEALIAHLSYLGLGCMAVPPSELDHSLNTGLQLHFLEGGYYPIGGPTEIARGFTQELEKAGGRVFVRASVQEIVVDPTSGEVRGVRLAKKEKRQHVLVRAPVVISSAGLATTTKKLLKPEHLSEDIVDKIGSLDLCDGHLFAFFGLEGEYHELGLPRKNLWILPGTDLDKGMARFQKGGISASAPEQKGPDGFHPAALANVADDPPPFGYCGLAFPSTKDPSYNDRHPGLTTAAIIAGDVPYAWFEKWENARIHARGETYHVLKSKIAERLKRVLLDRYPHLEDRIRYFDVGTPLDVNYYLGRTRGESYGLKMTTKKTTADQTWLFPKLEGTPKGLYFIGQDINSDGFAPAIFSACLCLATMDGPLWWFNLVPMFGGLRKTLGLLTAAPPL